uniref:Uncharacterized protein n=1 Tax=Romanomermis culicivorax TaxID=13658 RepID=A0A915KYI7_ROMCU
MTPVFTCIKPQRQRYLGSESKSIWATIAAESGSTCISCVYDSGTNNNARRCPVFPPYQANPFDPMFLERQGGPDCPRLQPFPAIPVVRPDPSVQKSSTNHLPFMPGIPDSPLGPQGPVAPFVPGAPESCDFGGPERRVTDVDSLITKNFIICAQSAFRHDYGIKFYVQRMEEK